MGTKLQSIWSRRRNWARFAVCSFMLLACVGCAGFGKPGKAKWHADYDSAETAVRGTERTMLIRFVDPRPGRRDLLDEAFKNKQLARRLGEYVCCVLYRGYEPDRRYVSQFGITRAPAVIVVHPDGTYHAKTGRMSADAVLAFLDAATSPGTPAIINPHIPRLAHFGWLDKLDDVVQSVRETGRPGLIVFYRRFAGDFKAIREMMSKHEVYSRVCHMVHGHDGGWNRWATTRETPFGKIALPAIVWLQPDGSHEVLEMPDSSQSIARFVDRCRTNAESVSETSVSQQTALSTQ